MARRKAYTEVRKQGQYRPAHVNGNTLFKGFQCLNSTCREFIFVPARDVEGDFRIPCPRCGRVLERGGETAFFDYEVLNKEDARVLDSGSFVVEHDAYVAEALEFKYCLLCNAMKPAVLFSPHARRKESGRQGECKLCKTKYNAIKNPTRIPDQHREAAQRRKLFKTLSAEGEKIDSQKVFERFGGECFKCGKPLVRKKGGYHLDHTLPVKYLWPLTTDTATLLCDQCNNAKHDRWPSEFYSDREMRRLARLTGFPYALLAGCACVNDQAVDEVLKDADGFIEEWIRYPEDIKKVRGLILQHTGIDLYNHATIVPPYLRD